MTREHWLQKTIKKIDEVIFREEMLPKEGYFQVGFGKSNKPKDYKKAVKMSVPDFEKGECFTTSLTVSETCQTQEEIVDALVWIIPQAFQRLKGKALTKCFNEYLGTKDFLLSELYKEARTRIIQEVEQENGKLVHDAVIRKEEEKEEKPSNKVIYFCPDCDFEFSIPKKKADKYQGMPTCFCGARMAKDYQEELNDNSNE